MAKVDVLIRYNNVTKTYDVVIDGKITTNPEIIGCYILDKVKKIKPPRKNIHRIIERTV